MKRQNRNWLFFAREDLKAAKVLFGEKIYSYVCFHSQQCVEKSLKALIEKKLKKAPKIHHLLELAEICKKAGWDMDNFKSDFFYLDKFYTLTRYPFVPGVVNGKVPNGKDAAKAIEIARKIYRFCFSEVGEKSIGGVWRKKQ